MNLLDIVQTGGRTYKKVSAINGGEYHGACPQCGGDDRFHVWPFQGEHGTYWCRKCRKSGDAVQYLIDFEGKSFAAACKELGKEMTDQQEYQAPAFKKPASAEFTPRQILAPADLWRQHAEKLVVWSHEQLLANSDLINYLAGRGIDRDHLKTDHYILGWNPGEKGNDLYRAREAWGLDTILADGNRKKKLWIPIGIVIAKYINGSVHSLRIRIPNERRHLYKSANGKELSYWIIKGSSTDTFVTRTDARAWMIVEAELDAIAIDTAAGDLTGAMAMGNNSAKPTEYAHSLLTNSLWIGNALDYDPKVNDHGKYENSGGDQWPWWRRTYPQAERHPVPIGKDPGEAFAAGIDIREWVKIGLPPIFTLPKAPKLPAIPPPSQDDFGADSPASSVQEAPETPQQPIVFTIVAADGRELKITDDPAEYQRLCEEGKIVFNSAEIAIIKAAGADKQQAARLIDLKETFGAVFPGGVIENLILMESEKEKL